MATQIRQRVRSWNFHGFPGARECADAPSEAEESLLPIRADGEMVG